MQNFEDWMLARCGKLTASRAKNAILSLKNGGESKVRESLKYEIVKERLTGEASTKFLTYDMQWGQMQEKNAIDRFSHETGLTVEPIGFIDHHCIKNLGASPDGFIRSMPALLETKCPSTETFIKWSIEFKKAGYGWVPDEHRVQMILQTSCFQPSETYRMPVFFCAYDPRIDDSDLQIIISKFEPTELEISDIENKCKKFLSEVDEIENIFRN